MDFSPKRALLTSLPSTAKAQPIFCLYPKELRAQAKLILSELPNPFYAVKANTMPLVLQTLHAAGFTHFDVASLLELKEVRKVNEHAICAFMNPVKQLADIEAAYRWGVRIFALDCVDELNKIISVTSSQDCTLIVRLALPPNSSIYGMTGKFGATQDEAVMLLRKISELGYATGMTFHVGSQCEEPSAYIEAIKDVVKVASTAIVELSVLDVGGGFPARYQGKEAGYKKFSESINEIFNNKINELGNSCILQSEPGRSLVASSGSVLVRVELRRGNTLFLNAGLHGLLSELRWMPGFHPVRRVSADMSPIAIEYVDYSFAGPSCDSGDFMPGPYKLPIDMKAGEWIEIGYLGAYCVELVTPFNGFGDYQIEVLDGCPQWHQ
ncbi:MAG: hypothetical protein WC742_09590 [Gallionellaceae bacterium]|jgi:ornithine decarboxylase